MPAEPTRHPRDLLKAHGLRPRKALGQNFLVSAANLDRVVDAAGLAADDAVLEIGTGLGRLTERLAARAGHVVSVEMDRGFHHVASGRLAETANAELLCCDFLESKHRINPLVREAVCRAGVTPDNPLKVVSNLPYGISSPAIVNLLEWDVPVGEMHLMLQKEVAARLAARPGTKQYGPLTAFVRYWAEAEVLFRLPRQAFWPVPEVASAFVRIARDPQRTRTAQYDVFAAVVARLLQNRRKTLRAVLRTGWGREAAERVTEELGTDLQRRVGEVGPDELEALARVLGPPQAR